MLLNKTVLVYKLNGYEFNGQFQLNWMYIKLHVSQVLNQAAKIMVMTHMPLNELSEILTGHNITNTTGNIQCN